MRTFQPKFDRYQARLLAEAYKSEEDTPALSAGKAIASGDFSATNLKIIFKWKTRDRGKTRIDKNTDLEIADALRLATSAAEPRSAIASLCGLNGVQIPVASAIMTAIKPSVFTIIDFRALEALSSDEDYTLNFYLDYVDFCKERANQWGMSLRDFDRALWQWSKDHGNDPQP